MRRFQSARFKSLRKGSNEVWRALCWWPRCDGEVAQVIAILQDDDDGSGVPTLYATPVVPADWVQDPRTGWWRAPTQAPRRAFRSGIQGARGVGGGIRADIGVHDAHGRALTKQLPDFLGLGPSPIILCSRCGEPSMLCPRHFEQAFEATIEEMEAHATPVTHS